jgi:desulfoferrodoxin-like iron-binding protein
MAATRREFLRAGVVTGLATAAASLPAFAAMAPESGALAYQHPKDPAHLTPLEMKHWPQLRVVGKVADGQPFELAIQIGEQIHPMTTEHHIEWVEVWAGDTRVERLEFAEPTWAQPVLTVTLVRKAPVEWKVRLNCNLHGPWENTITV